MNNDERGFTAGKMNKPEQSLRADTYKILRTKLAIPQPRTMWVSRPDLLARLDGSLEGRLTLVSAPPGYGKTTLVSEWIAARSQHSGSPLFAWVSLDAGDNDPVRFWRYIIAACQSFKTGTGASALEMIGRPQKPAYEAALMSLLNELAGLSGKQILVLEDYHVLQSQQIHETVTYLLDHLPANLHVIITTRQDPPLPLPRMRVRSELLELDARDLRFSSKEIQEFFSQTIHVSLTSGMIARLETRTEGWAAALRLVALSLENKQDPAQIERSIENLTGSQKHILDYLAAEVLNSQSEPIQDFLLRTSILSRLTGSLCDALTDREDCAAVLEQISKANLFLEPLDAAHQWYRYHTLFAEAMQQEALSRLGSEMVLSLHEQASHWLEEHEYLGDAIEAALSAKAYPRAATLIERIIQEAPGLANEVHTLRRWLDAFSEEKLHEIALLCFMHANAILYTSDRYAPETRALLEPPLRAAERLWRAEGDQEMIGRVFAFRSLVDWWQGDFAASFARVKEALALLAIHDAEWRGTCKLGLGVEALLAGEITQARQHILEARDLLDSAGNFYGVRAALQILGVMNLKQGELHHASELFQEVLQEAGEELSDRAQALAGLAEIAYERDELERAGQLASEALDISQKVQEHDALVNCTLTLARVVQAKGETERAQQMVQGLITKMHSSILADDIELGQAWIAYIKGDLEAAERWISTWEGDASTPVLVQERRTLMAARLLVARGEMETALTKLAPWLEKARRQGRRRSEIEILTLQAFARFSHHDRSQARQSLRKALRLAQPEGYKRVFLDEGERLAVLLKDVLTEVELDSLAGFARALLVAIVQEQAGAMNAASGNMPPLEALSDREKRVLRLLVVGRTYREIADELVVSLNTVKTQLESIYRKLGVSNRDEASEVARQLKII
jgi:LuxR family transcriptional regulator, maltose regulon positive regulatory protein